MSAEAIARTRIDTQFLLKSLGRIRRAQTDQQAEIELRDVIRKVQSEATFSRIEAQVRQSMAGAAPQRRSA